MLIVVKYGGNALPRPGAPDDVLDDIAERVHGGDAVVLVHGGGPQIDAGLSAVGVVTRRVAGLRVTDDATLAVTEYVLCGTVNKALVRALARREMRAVGISGEDGRLLLGRRTVLAGGESLGHVGEVTTVQSAVLTVLLAAGYLPVVAPLALERETLAPLNINADRAAGAIAGALGADAYIVVTNVQRVLRDRNDPQSGIGEITPQEARGYLADGTFSDGMIPKAEGALDAIACGVKRAMICGSGPHALTRALAGEATTFYAPNREVV